jgi:hypothetical protein
METRGIRALFLIVFLTGLVVWTAGCAPTGTPTTQSREELARFCGGGGVSPGTRAVIAGVENPFFSATSRQVVTPKPDVKIGEVKGRTITLIARDNNTTITCGCPAGCTNPVGCVIAQSPPGPPGGPITCSGDCTTTSSCCFGCGWVW